MTDSYTFSDDAPEDAYTDGAGPEPMQVAIRLHEIRSFVASAAGEAALTAWWDLTDDEQELAVALGTVIVQWIAEHEFVDRAEVAQSLHAVQRFWSGGALPRWENLSNDARQLAVSFMSDLIAWLDREGTLGWAST